jgi:hypothetical protein
MFKKIFVFDTNQPTAWHKVILWWELRRLLLNLLLSLFIGFFAVIVLIKYKEDPRFAFMYLIGAGYFILWTNIFYTLSWILHLILRISDASFFKSVISAMFICVLGLTFAAASLPTLGFLFFDEISAANDSSSDPVMNDLSGAYQFTEESRRKMKLPDSAASSTRIWISSNHSFLVAYFPSYQNSNSATDYRLINGNGSWTYKPEGSGLIIELNFGDISDAESYQKLASYKDRSVLRAEDLQKGDLYFTIGGDKLYLERIKN